MAISKEVLDKMTIEDLKILHLELDKKHDDLVSNFEGIKEKISEKDTEITKLKSDKLDLLLQIPVKGKSKEEETTHEETEKSYEELIKEMGE